MSCELYLYWRTALANLPAATAAMQAFQRQQCLSTPGLQARLLQRVDASGNGDATVMETYALPAMAGGVGEALLPPLPHGGDAASKPWRAGARHLEVFSAVEPQ